MTEPVAERVDKPYGQTGSTQQGCSADPFGGAAPPFGMEGADNEQGQERDLPGHDLIEPRWPHCVNRLVRVKRRADGQADHARQL